MRCLAKSINEQTVTIKSIKEVVETFINYTRQFNREERRQMERREEERKRARQEDIRRTEAKEGMQTRREEPTVTGQKTLQQKEG